MSVFKSSLFFKRVTFQTVEVTRTNITRFSFHTLSASAFPDILFRLSVTLFSSDPRLSSLPTHALILLLPPHSSLFNSVTVILTSDPDASFSLWDTRRGGAR